MESTTKVMLFLLIITIPFRLRIVLKHRLIGPIYRDYTDFLLFLPDIFLILMLILWITRIILIRKKINTHPVLITYGLLSLTMISFIGLSSSVDKALSFYHLLRMILLFLFFLYLVTEPLRVSTIIKAISFQIIIQSVIGITQVLSQESLGLSFLGELDLDPAVPGVSVVAADGIRFLRLYGLSDHPNIIGGSLAFGLVLLYGWVIKSKDRSSIWALLAIGLGLPALFLTFSRSAWIAFFIGMVFIVVIIRKRGDPTVNKRISGLIIAGLLVSLPFILSYSEFLGVRLNVENSFTQISLENRSISERRELNKAAVEIFTDSPIIGTGLGTFPVALYNKFPDVAYNFQPPHFVLLEVAAELGLFGALFYFVILVSPWIMLWIKEKTNPINHRLAIISAVLLSVSIIGFLDYYTWLLVPGRLWQWLIWGIWGNAYNDLGGLGQNG